MITKLKIIKTFYSSGLMLNNTYATADKIEITMNSIKLKPSILWNVYMPFS